MSSDMIEAAELIKTCKNCLLNDRLCKFIWTDIPDEYCEFWEPIITTSCGSA